VSETTDQDFHERKTQRRARCLAGPTSPSGGTELIFTDHRHLLTSKAGGVCPSGAAAAGARAWGHPCSGKFGLRVKVVEDLV